MNAEYINDPDLGNGYGKIIFSGAMFGDGPWAVSIQRGDDQAFLTGKKINQWVGTASAIPLRGEAGADGKLTLFVGPEIVQSLDSLAAYRINLKCGDGSGIAARLKIAEPIAYLASGSLDNTADVPEDQHTASAPQPENKPEAQTQPETETQENKEPPAEKLEMPAASQAKRRHLLRYVILALLAIACVGWFFIDKYSDREKSPAPVQIEQTKKQTPPAKENVADRVGKFFQDSGKTPAKAVDLARQLPKSGKEDQDALYRLYYYASENGEPGLLLDYGATLDPSRPQWGSIEKDGAAAWKIYELAVKKNIPGAQAAADNLRKWLEQQAGQGNASARIWLGQIN